jgi:acetolactate synthase-1/3 small subunit
VERDLALVRVRATAERRSEILELVDIFRARIVDVGRNDVMIEMSGTEEKIEALVDLLRPYGIREMARTGRIALARSGRD